MFLFVILADLKGGIFEMLQINMCFYHPVVHPRKIVAFFLVLGERREAFAIFQCAVWEVNICCLPDLRKQRQCCTARSTRGYQTGVHRFGVPLITSWWLWMLCSWRVGSKFFFLALFFSLEVRVWQCREISFFDEKEGVHP